MIRFGDFELDAANAELRRSGDVVKLPPQPFKALELLVSRPGCLVTREEFRAALWGDESFVDFNAGLNFCIRQLRLALDDPAARSALIVAVPRRGYKFVASIEVVAPSSAEATSDASAATARTDEGGPRGLWQWRAARIQANLSGDDCEGRAVPLAISLAHLGDFDAALRWLERAADRRADSLIFAAVHPAFEPLRSNARFDRLLKRVGLGSVGKTEE